MADLSFVNTREFSRLISKPSTLTVFDMAMLEDLVLLYPFSAPLHASYAFALKKFKPEKYEEYLSKAALYTPDRTLLYKIINHIADFENDVEKTEVSGYLLDDPDFVFEEENTNIPDTQNKIDTETDDIPDDDWLNKQLQGTNSPYGEESDTTTDDQPVIAEEPDSEVAENLVATVDESETTSQNDIAPADKVDESKVENIDPENTEEPAENITGEKDETVYSEVDENYLNVVKEQTWPIEEPADSEEQISHTEIDEDFFVEPDQKPQVELSEDEKQETVEENQVAEIENIEYEPAFAETPDFSDEASSSTEILPAADVEEAQKEEDDDYLLEQTSAAAIEIISNGAEYQEPFENTIETVIPDTEALIFIQRSVEDDALLEESEPNEVAPAQNEIIGSIASTDYFIFDKSAIDPLKKEEELHIETPLAAAIEQPLRTENSEQISRYNDDKMPFSFLWWLNKTRKEHAESFQPYTSTVSTVHKAASGELNQQIIENIFHIQPEINVFEDYMQAPVTFEGKRKEDVIIEKFITEDPQIRPPKGEKLDTENKARKSSEDNLDLVSETLAKIYTDQMLYHKAIDTYRKLSLKYPEKRSYFAGQILDLEKRFN